MLGLVKHQELSIYFEEPVGRKIIIKVLEYRRILVLSVRRPFAPLFSFNHLLGLGRSCSNPVKRFGDQSLVWSRVLEAQHKSWTRVVRHATYRVVIVFLNCRCQIFTTDVDCVGEHANKCQTLEGIDHSRNRQSIAHSFCFSRKLKPTSAVLSSTEN